jgi:hypothetical protein
VTRTTAPRTSSRALSLTRTSTRRIGLANERSSQATTRASVSLFGGRTVRASIVWPEAVPVRFVRTLVRRSSVQTSLRR